MPGAMDDWPPQAIPAGNAELDHAIDTVHRREGWARMFTRAALADEVVGFFSRGWNVECLRHAVVFRPDRSRYGTPPASAQQVLDRWTAWPYPPIQGYELGTALAALFNRDSERTIRDDWAAKAIPAHPVQAFRATRWMRFNYGWSTYATLSALAALLVPWFARGWCPAAILWIIEHKPNGKKYSAVAKNLDELQNRIAAWEKAGKTDSPPITGDSWDVIVDVRRRRIATERVNEDAVARFQEHQRLRNERWHYKRSLAGMKERDNAIDLTLRRLHPTMPRAYEHDNVTAIVDDDLCKCQRYFRLPGQPLCAACLTGDHRPNPAFHRSA